MKRKKYETRGVTAAVIEGKITPTGIAALDEFLSKAEEAFILGAEEHALAARDEMAKMSPHERRRAQPTRITLSSETDGDMRVTLTATISSSGKILREKKTVFFWDRSSSLLSKNAKTRKNKKTNEKL